MVTIEELFKHYKPGIIFGAVIGFGISLYIETVVFSNEFMAKIVEWNTLSKGFLVIGIFALMGSLFQRWQRW